MGSDVIGPQGHRTGGWWEEELRRMRGVGGAEGGRWKASGVPRVGVPCAIGQADIQHDLLQLSRGGFSPCDQPELALWQPRHDCMP